MDNVTYNPAEAAERFPKSIEFLSEYIETTVKKNEEALRAEAEYINSPAITEMVDKLIDAVYEATKKAAIELLGDQSDKRNSGTVWGGQNTAVTLRDTLGGGM